MAKRTARARRRRPVTFEDVAEAWALRAEGSPFTVIVAEGEAPRRLLHIAQLKLQVDALSKPQGAE